MVGSSGDHVPRLSQDDLFFVSVYLDDRQERLVELAAYLRPGYGVDLGALAHDGLCSLVALLDLIAGLLGFCKLTLGLLLLSGDAVLLGLEQVEGDGFGVGHLDELATLLVEPGQPLLGLPH